MLRVQAGRFEGSVESRFKRPVVPRMDGTSKQTVSQAGASSQ